MRVSLTTNTGATDYWRFPWLRYLDAYSIEWKPPIFDARLLASKPDLRFPFVRVKEHAKEDIYYPLESTPGISREFTRLDNEDGALAFANKYGILGLSGVRRYSSRIDELDTNGENIYDWLAESAELKQAYEVWDSVLSRDKHALRGLVITTPQGVQAILPPAGRFGERYNPSLGKLKDAEILQMAKLFLVKRFNDKMNGMASPMLLLDAKREFRPYNSPTSLLGALWLEFGQLVSGVRKQIICESCGQSMDVTNNRSHKRKHDRCSLREKMQRYRKLQKDLKG